jgi:hypothetical protein
MSQIDKELCILELVKDILEAQGLSGLRHSTDTTYARVIAMLLVKKGWIKVAPAVLGRTK